MIHCCHLISIHCGMVTQPALEVTPQFSGASYILGVTPMVGTPPSSNAASPLSHQKPCQACWGKTLMNQISNSHHPRSPVHWKLGSSSLGTPSLNKGHRGLDPPLRKLTHPGSALLPQTHRSQHQPSSSEPRV